MTDAARVKRAIIVNRPKDRSPDHGLREALHCANIPDPLFIDVQDGTNISNTLAPHFGGSATHASNLAAEKSPHGHAVVLRANSERSQKHCEKYMGEFIESLPEHDGNIRLILSFEDPGMKETESHEDFAVIVYDGMLRPEEMQAYVSYRMLGRQDFKSTSLLRHLVTEFASFDVCLAEDLMRMTNSEILGLPESLTQLLATKEEKWAMPSWIRGSASLTCPNETHTLHEWYQAIHTSPLSDKGRDAVNRRYWRACIKAISPWMEERRHLVVSELNPVLLQLEPGGAFKIPVGNNGEFDTVKIKDLEYNNLLYQRKVARDRNIKLTSRQNTAFEICAKVRTVRNEIAHARRPQLPYIQYLVLSLEDFCSSA